MNVLRIAVLDHCRRNKSKAFASAEVVKQMFPEDWKLFLPELKAEILQMAKEGLICLISKGEELSLSQIEHEFLRNIDDPNFLETGWVIKTKIK